MPKIKTDPADRVFSQYIRKRDGRCMRCGSTVRFNEKGMPVSHQASHYHGRRKESVRFDPDNVDCLCYGCHVEWGSTDRQAYTAFKIDQLGQAGYDKLTVRANTYKKKDRSMERLKAKTLLESL